MCGGFSLFGFFCLFLFWILQSMPLVEIGLDRWDKKVIPGMKCISETLLRE